DAFRVSCKTLAPEEGSRNSLPQWVHRWPNASRGWQEPSRLQAVPRWSFLRRIRETPPSHSSNRWNVLKIRRQPQCLAAGPTSHWPNPAVPGQMRAQPSILLGLGTAGKAATSVALDEKALTHASAYGVPRSFAEARNPGSDPFRGHRPRIDIRSKEQA